MPRPLVIRDPQHPDFPHGQPVGRSRGCACQPCRDAKLRANKRNKMLRQRGLDQRRATPEVYAKFEAHLRRLVDTGASYSAIARAAGCSHSTLVRTTASGKVAPKTAAAVLAVRPHDLAEHLLWVPRDEAVFRTRTMQALGYPISWQREQIGSQASTRFLYTEKTSGNVEAWVDKAIRELAERIGDAPATTDMGFTPQAISHAKSRARTAGYYPPIHYDEHGNLDHRSIPDHPWASADDKAHRKIALLRAYVVNPEGLSNAAVARVTGETEREVERLIERLRLRTNESRRPKRMAWLRAQLDRFDTDAVDPVLFCIEVGLYTADRFPQDHPAVARWREAHPEWVHPSALRAMARRHEQELDLRPIERHDDAGQVAA